MTALVNRGLKGDHRAAATLVTTLAAPRGRRRAGRGAGGTRGRGRPDPGAGAGPSGGGYAAGSRARGRRRMSMGATRSATAAAGPAPPGLRRLHREGLRHGLARAALPAQLAHRGDRPSARRGRGRARHAPGHHRAAAQPEVDLRLGGAARLAARPRPDQADHLRLLRPGAERQARQRLPPGGHQRLVPPAVPAHPPRPAEEHRDRGGDHRPRLSPGHLGRRRPDRPGCGPDRHRRSDEAAGRALRHQAAGGPAMVRHDAAVAPRRPGPRRDPAGHAAPACRGPRRPRPGQAGLGASRPAGDRRGRRRHPDRSRTGPPAPCRRGAAPGSRQLRHAGADPTRDGQPRLQRAVPAGPPAAGRRAAPLVVVPHLPRGAPSGRRAISSPRAGTPPPRPRRSTTGRPAPPGSGAGRITIFSTSGAAGSTTRASSGRWWPSPGAGGPTRC